ncbi:MAG: methyltransferase [bacterium]
MKATEATEGGGELFDRFDTSYEEALARGVSATGEDAEFYLQERVAWFGKALAARGVSATRVLDFGCGTGNGAQFLLTLPGAREVVGIDVSDGLLARARAEHGSRQVHFENVATHNADGTYDVAYCNGVFHHIPPAERAGAVAVVHASLKSGGLFAFWENNPWNPGTRYVMSRIEFDRDAITLSPPDARRLLTSGGFDILGTTSRFFFPHVLRMFRTAEPLLSSIPLGGQYQVLCRKR